MNRIVLFLFCSLAVACVKAQTTDQIIALFERHPVSESGQIETRTLLTEAVTPALSIIRQQYRLESNGEFYGRNGKLYFGETYTLGVKVSNATILQRSVLFPWENNADYIRVSAGGKYKAVNFYSMQRPLNSNEWNTVYFDFENLTKVKSSDSLLVESLDKINDFGLPIDETEGYKKGFMIWAYSTTNLLDSAMNVELMQNGFSIEVKNEEKTVNVSPARPESVLGGVFVVPVVERAGYIKVLLVGVAARDSSNTWKLELFTRSSENSREGEPAQKEETGKGNQIPKENDASVSEDFELTPIK